MPNQDVRNAWIHLFTQKLDAKTNAICQILQKPLTFAMSVEMVENVLIKSTNLQLKLVNIACARFNTEVSYFDSIFSYDLI